MTITCSYAIFELTQSRIFHSIMQLVVLFLEMALLSKRNFPVFWMFASKMLKFP